jgi:acetyl esterase
MSDKKPNPVINAVSNVVAALRADDDQIAVAKAHESLEPEAIEKLTPEEARRQPTVADAVKKLLEQQNRSAVPEALVPGVTTRELTVDGATGPLAATLYTPAGQGPFPVVLYFHGGGWVIANRQVYDGGAGGVCVGAQERVFSVG